MVECGICLEDYQEDELELHQEMCVVRLMFQCSLCHENYVSKEGLWNHLDLHEISDAGKELHYQEITAKHKLHQCVLCNDQRAYSESSYWKHVHDVHDGFFLRCSDCGENFRSEKLRDDHAFSHCKARDETVASVLNGLEYEHVPIGVENMTSDAEHSQLSWGGKSSNANQGLNNQLSEQSHVNLNSTFNSAKSKSNGWRTQFPCNTCGMTFSKKGLLLRHKKSKYTCLEGRLQKCPHCGRRFQRNEYQAHFQECEKKTFSCELCPLKFPNSGYLGSHMRNVHRGKRVLRNPEQDPNQVNDIAEENVKNPSSGSSGMKCVHCGKECVRARYLREHIVQCHQPTMCSVCGIIFQGCRRVRYHKLLKHTERKFECANCSKKFYCIKLYKRHSNVCHPVQNAFPTQKRSDKLNLKDKSDSLFQPTRPKHGKEHDDSQFGAEGSENIGLNLEIKVEETMLQKQEHQTQNEHPGRSTATTLVKAHTDVNPQSIVRAPVQSNSLSYKSSDELIMQDRSDPKVAAENPSSEASCTKCSHCGIEESSAASLACHILVHHEPVACDLCGITLSSLSQAQHHVKEMHKNAKFKCPHCSMQCFARTRLQQHLSKCSNEKVLCDFCGKTFKDVIAVTIHRGNFCHAYKKSKEQEQKNDETDTYTAQTKCFYCYEVFASPGYLNHHLKVCHELTKCDICGITVLGISAIKYHKHLCGNKSKDIQAGSAEDLGNGIQVKEEYLEDGEEILAEHQTTTESSECRGMPIDQNESLVSQEADDQLCLCSICGLDFTSNPRKLRYHMIVCHTEPQHKCSFCQKMFHLVGGLHRHEKGCSELRCNKCGIKFVKRVQLKYHKIDCTR